MALRAVPDHPKFADLKARLGQPKGAVLGWLEAIWHFTGRFTPQGNIGKYPDAQIEAWVEWKGDPGSLIQALLASGWIDEDATHRLLVHDWAQHADKATKLSLSRSKTDFCTLTVHTLSVHRGETSPEVGTLYGLPVPVPVPEPVPETKTKAPAKAKPSPDPRAGEFKSAFQDAFQVANKVPAPWDAKEATNLARFLKANPTITLEQWRRILYHRAQSPINQKANLSRWVAPALAWLDAEADEWGKPLGAGRRGATAPARPMEIDPEKQRALDEKNERESYAMWLGMNEEYKRLNPWRGRVFEEVA